MTSWFSADFHLGHSNILEYSNRPFSSVTEMNESIIENHNKLVKPSDCWYFLGDFALCKTEDAIEMLKRLNGQKFTVFGNHDKYNRKSKEYTSLWQWAKDYAEIRIEDQAIVLMHFPLLSWNRMHYKSWDLHGHCHGSLQPNAKARRLDVGVDCFNYNPVSFEQIKLIMDERGGDLVDHHGARGDGY